MFDITLPGTSDSKAIDDPVSRLAFPVLTFCNNGCLNLKFRARRKDLERTTTFEVKVGLFRNKLVVDSNGAAFLVDHAEKVRNYGVLWGWTPLLVHRIVVRLVPAERQPSFSFDEIRRKFFKYFRAYGPIPKETQREIKAATSVGDLIGILEQYGWSGTSMHGW